MSAALIGSINKEELVRLRIDIPESLHEELKIYSHYVGGKEEDIPEVTVKMLKYVLDRESKGSQGKKYKEFKQKFLKEFREDTKDFTPESGKDTFENQEE